MKKSIIGKISIISVVVCVFLSCEKDSEIIFSPTGVPVDLGLSVKWASCNVGANSPEDYGDYFAWGEIEPKKKYTDGTYTYHDNPVTLPYYADAAHANWGGSWRMPTKAEWMELVMECTWEWSNFKGVEGYIVRSESNGNSIFLPAAGYRIDSSLYGAGLYGDYWLSSLKTDDPYYAFEMFFGSDNSSYWGNYFRYFGHSVRPVCP